MELLIVSLAHGNVETEFIIIDHSMLQVTDVWKRLLVNDIHTPTLKPEATFIFLLEISISFRVTPQSQYPKEPFPDHDQGHNPTHIQTSV